MVVWPLVWGHGLEGGFCLIILPPHLLPAVGKC